MNDSICKKKVTRFHFTKLELYYTFQGIPFLQVNAQYPSGRTKLIMIKRFLGRLRPCDSPLSQNKNISRFFTYKGFTCY